ncbi:MAG: FAD-dependent oxidoreductase [Candidatus Omnitrophica bacterium]|nr:FAD-dependent oxidoreductase [Candidatus Omnitrophota bacterium]MBL7151616.1 FAD-dependent oxidoreductase [Candidatus Omnitrophota bacterium]MBL7210598.1 FAD-dependent oxidoreductase [Candidatus Omnitrophota bacterium]
MKEIRAILKERITRTRTTQSFRFIPSEKVSFVPGQFLQLIFDPADKNNKELNKYLSFSASPAKEYIEVTKRLSQSPFSQKLSGLKTGDELILKAPIGNCVFKDEYKRIGFLIGGIGITPVISIIEYIMDKKLDTDVVLFYSNRTPDDIAFKKELDYWQSVNKNIKVIFTVTDCKPDDPACRFGRIDADLVKQECWDIKERALFIFGPPKMVEAMKGLCLGLGCRQEDLRTESFIGY